MTIHQTEPARELTLSDFKVGQVWRTRGGRTCTIQEVDPPSVCDYPITSDLYEEHYHFPNGRSCLCGDTDYEDDLVELISEADLG